MRLRTWLRRGLPAWFKADSRPANLTEVTSVSDCGAELRSSDEWCDLTDALAGAESATICLPHVVLIADRETGSVSSSGPFTNGLTALVHAEEVHRQLDMDDTLSIVAVPLYGPPSCDHQPWLRA